MRRRVHNPRRRFTQALLGLVVSQVSFILLFLFCLWFADVFDFFAIVPFCLAAGDAHHCFVLCIVAVSLHDRSRQTLNIRE